MLYEDKHGKLWLPEEVEGLSEHEIDELSFHVYDSLKPGIV